MSLEDALEKYRAYFNNKIETYGATPKGVDYNGPAAQNIRFEQLVKVINPSRPFTVLDYGCGFGAMFDFLNAKGWTFEYYGFDMLEKMVLAAREAHQGFTNVHFSAAENETTVCDYLTAGAIFNNKFDASFDEWRLRSLEVLGR